MHIQLLNLPHAGVAFIFDRTPSVGGFLSIFCDATVPGVEEDSVVVTVAGPGGSSIDNAVRPNDVYRGGLLFFSLAESNSGVYICQVMVDGITVRTATAALNVAGKLETSRRERGRGREKWRGKRSGGGGGGTYLSQFFYAATYSDQSL